MAGFKKTQNSFQAGEVSPDFFAHGAAGALAELSNVSVSKTGALARRPGSVRIGPLPDSNSIIVPFGTDYILVISPSFLRIYRKDGTYAGSFPLSWDIGGDIGRIQWAERFDTMIFVHPAAQPKVLTQSGGVFEFHVFRFAEDAQKFPIMPFMRFSDTEDATLTLSSHSNGNTWAKVKASKPIWTPDAVGGYLSFMDRKWEVASVESQTDIVISTVNSFSIPASPISDWKEAAFSPRRGWPRSITFHQDRLVFGGSRDWPCGLWLSKTGKHRDFGAGTGLDDEAIFITLLSETRQKIATCVSGRDLQILTDSGEWAISSTPLTPSNIDVRQYTGIGTKSDRNVPPQKINGNTVFVSNNEIRELALDDMGENYNANDLALAARHIVDSPVSMAYSAELCQLFVVMKNGTMAVLTKQPALGISAWSVYRTAGLYKYCAVQNGNVYAVVDRGGNAFLEMFSMDALRDSGEYDFEWRARAAPLVVDGHCPKKVKVLRVSARVENTPHINVDGLDFFNFDSFSGDVSANSLGTKEDASMPLWTISSNRQTPAKILSVGCDGEYLI